MFLCKHQITATIICRKQPTWDINPFYFFVEANLQQTLIPSEIYYVIFSSMVHSAFLKKLQSPHTMFLWIKYFLQHKILKSMLYYLTLFSHFSFKTTLYQHNTLWFYVSLNPNFITMLYQHDTFIIWCLLQPTYQDLWLPSIQPFKKLCLGTIPYVHTTCPR